MADVLELTYELGRVRATSPEQAIEALETERKCTVLSLREVQPQWYEYCLELPGDKLMENE